MLNILKIVQVFIFVIIGITNSLSAPALWGDCVVDGDDLANIKPAIITEEFITYRIGYHKINIPKSFERLSGVAGGGINFNDFIRTEDADRSLICYEIPFADISEAEFLKTFENSVLTWHKDNTKEDVDQLMGGKRSKLAWRVENPTPDSPRGKLNLTLFVKYENGYLLFIGRDSFNTDNKSNNVNLAKARLDLIIKEINIFLNCYEWDYESNSEQNDNKFKTQQGTIGCEKNSHKYGIISWFKSGKTRFLVDANLNLPTVYHDPLRPRMTRTVDVSGQPGTEIIQICFDKAEIAEAVVNFDLAWLSSPSHFIDTPGASPQFKLVGLLMRIVQIGTTDNNELAKMLGIWENILASAIYYNEGW